MSYKYFKLYTESYLNLIEKSLIPDTAAVILIRNNKALILKRGPGAPWMPNAWNLPGGRIDNQESPAEAAVRETFEESGIDLPYERFSSLSIDKHKEEGWVLQTFLAIVDDLQELPEGEESYSERSSMLPNTIHLDKNGKKVSFKENDDYRWVSIDELDKYEFVPMVKENIRKALK